MEKKTNVLKIIIVALVILLIATLVIGFIYIKSKDKTQKKPADEYTMELDEFLVNLKTDGDTPSYLKTKIALMYPKKKSGEKLENNIDKIRDAINDKLRTKTSNEMLDTSKVEELKKEIVLAINDALGEEIVGNIYFTDIVIQ